MFIFSGFTFYNNSFCPNVTEPLGFRCVLHRYVTNNTKRKHIEWV